MMFFFGFFFVIGTQLNKTFIWGLSRIDTQKHTATHISKSCKITSERPLRWNKKFPKDIQRSRSYDQSSKPSKET